MGILYCGEQGPLPTRNDWVYNATMPGQSTEFQYKGTEQFVVDGYHMTVMWYENPSAWDVQVWGIDPIHRYWVERGNFYPATINLSSKVCLPHITETIEPAERKAVLKAIDEWNTRSRAA
jgi:hypothetical protein